MNKKRIIKISIFISLILIIYIVYKNTIGNDIFMINLRWNISIPKADNTIYSKLPESSFNGDGITYLVYNYKNNKKIEKLNKFNWTGTNDNNELEEDFKDEHLFNELDIPKEYRFNLNDEYLYYKRSRKNNTEIIWIVYMIKENKLYIYEIIS